MIAPLRKRHRRTVLSLLLVVPVLYLLALAARPETPVVDRLPPALADEVPGEVLSDYGALFTGQAIAARLRGDGPRRWIELEPAEPVTRPEVLLYWAPETGESFDRLPEGAYLLGALAGVRRRAFALPDEALGQGGRLVLYSLGHQEVVDSAPLPAAGAPPLPSTGPSPAPEIPAADGPPETPEAPS